MGVYLFQICRDTLFVCAGTCGLSSFLNIRCCQPDADSVFVDIESQAALLVIIGLLAQFWKLGSVVGKQPFLQLGIVGVDLCGWVFGIVIYLSDFLFLGKSCSYRQFSLFYKFSRS